MGLIRKIAAIALCIVIVMCTLPVISRAVEFTVELDGYAFEGNETTVVTISVYNDSDAPMTDIHISSLGQSYGFNGRVEPLETAEMQIPSFLITPDAVGKDITFTLTWKEAGVQKSAQKKVYIADAEDIQPTDEPTLPPEELIDFTCYSDNPRAEKGEKIKIYYKVANNSPINISDITITDSGISDGPVITGKSVRAGDSGTFSYEYTMGDKNITTAPIMSYTMDGEIKSLRGNSITLESVTVNMDVNVTMGEASEKGTEFIIKIANNGNKPISSVRIYQGLEANDDTKIEHAFDLGVGESREISYVTTPKGKTEVTFIITGKLATGEEYEYRSDTYTVWEYINGKVEMNLTAEVAERIDSDGYVSIDFTLKNTGDVDMANISLSEKNMGKIGSFSDLTPGGEETVKLTIYAGEAKDLEFYVTAAAPTGQEFEFTYDVSAQEVSNGSNDATVSGSFNAAAIDVGGAVSGLLKKILTVLAIVSGILGVGLVVLSVFEFQQNADGKKTDNAE